jgi:hypothetical protein
MVNADSPDYQIQSSWVKTVNVVVVQEQTTPCESVCAIVGSTMDVDRGPSLKSGRYHGEDRLSCTPLMGLRIS